MTDCVAGNPLLAAVCAILAAAGTAGLLRLSPAIDPPPSQPAVPRTAARASAAAEPKRAPGPVPRAQRRALLVGVDDYLAALQPGTAAGAHAAERGLNNLGGAVHDVQAMREMLLTSRFGFAARDVLVLTDRQATRRAILAAIEEWLVKPARPGDVELFYFAGHGSQVANSRSDERDGLDESIVPADSAGGALDIRDKELRRLFNRLLDRGARLTVVLDSCHSGSGARGLAAGDRWRGIRPDLHDVADGSEWGPRPEDRGALVLAATQDFDRAWEARDERQQVHGAFSLALLWAIRGSAHDEAAADTFLRARSRLQDERRFQEPVMAGNAEARLTPFLGTGRAPRSAAPAAVVERIERGGGVLLAGGWAEGLTPGSELRPVAADGAAEVRLVVTEMLGLGRCRARLVSRSAPDRRSPPALAPGTRLQVVLWAAPPSGPLRVWMPQVPPATGAAAAALAGELARAGRRSGLRWISDPTAETPGAVLRWRDRGWDLLAADGSPRRFAAGTQAAAILAALPGGGAALFVELPATHDLIAAMGIGAGTLYDGVEAVERPEDADYVLAGRLAGGQVEYAWVRPEVGAVDRGRSGLPIRSDWIAVGSGAGAASSPADAAQLLATAILRLRKIHGWRHLESPPGATLPYRLGFRHEGEKDLVHDHHLLGQERYGIVLRRPAARPVAGKPRYFYVFMIDSHGKSVLLYPPGGSGSVENRIPLASGGGAAPEEIPLGEPTSFRVTDPYGTDTYFLLTTEEPIPDPWVLEWDGVRTRGPRGGTPLEELLAVTGGATRSAESVVVPPNWSLQKELFESVPPHADRGGAQ